MSIDVAVGIIFDPQTNKVLVAQRNTNDAHLGKWEFPGGKINAGETAELALKRELTEELGIRVISLEPFDTLQFDYPHASVNLNFFLVDSHAGRASGLEGQSVQWVDVCELSELDMLEANRQIIAKLKTQN